VNLSTPTPPLVRTVTIPELARRMGRPRPTVFRIVRALHQRCKARTCSFWEGDGPRDAEADRTHALWLVRPTNGPWRVNESRLAMAHPEMYGLPSPRELAEQIVEVRAYAREGLKSVNVRVGALAAAMREHGRRHHGGTGP
jgi:hypothetical protein